MKYKQIEKTPFTIVTDEEKKICFGVLGNYRVTDKEEQGNEPKIQEKLKKVNWENIVQVISIITELTIKKMKENEVQRQNH